MLEARKKLIGLFPELTRALSAETRTQGSRIQLPFEQATSKAIELVRNYVNFLPRRDALILPGEGFVTFSGGFGTINEALEVLRGGNEIFLDGRGFWRPILDPILSSWRSRGFAPESELTKIRLVDGPAEGLPKLVTAAIRNQREFLTEEDVVEAKARAREARDGLRALTALAPAVTFIGSRRLLDDDAEVKTSGRLAELLTRQGVPVRIGGDGALLRAIERGIREADSDVKPQALLLDEGQLDLAELEASAAVAHVVHSAPVHKLLLYENTDAIVAAPGGIGTFDEVFEVATLMQTKKIPKRPLILIGRQFWQPILDALARGMFSNERKTIGPDDMKLFTVVDNEQEAADAILQHRSSRAQGAA
jgi:uncharacterized protein (TIGR00730 family)